MYRAWRRLSRRWPGRGVHGGQEVADLWLGGEVDGEDLAAFLVQDEFGGSAGQDAPRVGVRPAHAVEGRPRPAGRYRPRFPGLPRTTASSWSLVIAAS